jgi:hypothetical protein
LGTIARNREIGLEIPKAGWVLGSIVEGLVQRNYFIFLRMLGSG